MQGLIAPDTLKHAHPIVPGTAWEIAEGQALPKP
jgi:hypothetical protein